MKKTTIILVGLWILIVTIGGSQGGLLWGLIIGTLGLAALIANWSADCAKKELDKCRKELIEIQKNE